MFSVMARVRGALASFAREPRGRAWWLAQLEVGLITLLMFMLRSPFEPGMPLSGLDPSWRQALPEATARGLQIGREVVYSFGPLSGIYSNEYHPAVFVSTVCITLLLCVVYAVLLQRLTRLALGAWWSRGLVMVAFTLLVSQHDCFSFAFAPLGVALLFSDEPASAPVEVAWWWSMATLTLVKASFGAIGALIFVIVLLTRLRDRPRLLRLVAFPVSCVGMWLLTGQSLLSLPYYALNSLHVSTGYAASMSFTPPAWTVTAYWFASVAMLVALGFAHRSRGRRPWHMPVPCLLLIGWLIFKGGYIRLNFASTSYTLAVLAVAAWIFCAGLARNFRQRLAYASSLLPVLLAVAFLSTVDDGRGRKESTRASFPAQVWEQLSALPAIVSGNFKALLANDYRERYDAANAALRKRYPITKLSGGYDIFPHDANVIFSHGVEWRPRPNYQSYATYTPELIAQNLAHYRGPRAPDNVLFELRTIDRRYPTHDDQPTLLEVLSRYEVVAMRRPFAQLKRRDVPIAYRFEAERKLTAQLGETVDLKAEAGTLLWARIDIKKSALGSLYSLFYRVPMVHMEVTFDGGARRTFRVVPTITSSGFLLSPFVSGTGEFLALNHGGELPGKLVKFIRLRAEDGCDRMFQSQIELTLSKLSFGG